MHWKLRRRRRQQVLTISLVAIALTVCLLPAGPAKPPAEALAVAPVTGTLNRDG